MLSFFPLVFMSTNTVLHIVLLFLCVIGLYVAVFHFVLFCALKIEDI